VEQIAGCVGETESCQQGGKKGGFRIITINQVDKVAFLKLNGVWNLSKLKGTRVVFLSLKMNRFKN
jgi:hypothetical protein